MSVVDITELDKAEVLLALYNNSRCLGSGFLQAVNNYTLQDARRDIDESPDHYFDYVRRRILKVDLSGDTFDSWLYDRDNGEGAAARAIEKLRRKNDSAGHSSGD